MVWSVNLALKKYPATKAANVLAKAFVPSTSAESTSKSKPQPNPAKIPMNCPSVIEIQTHSTKSKSGVILLTEIKFRKTTCNTERISAIIAYIT